MTTSAAPAETTPDRWILPTTPDPDAVAFLQRTMHLPRVVAELLVRRGLDQPESVAAFMQPRLDQLHDPHLMRGMSEMVEALVAVRQGDRRIAVHGDYDVDGLTSTTLLTRVLTDLGYTVEPFVPDRLRDGYGVSQAALERFANSGIRTVLTCDTGIKAVDEIRYAVEQLGLRVLVSDHHQPGEELPPAHVIVDPHQPDCEYPFKPLCGVAVAFKIMQALVRRLGVDETVVLNPHLDLVALGTICDVMPLTGENRIFVRQGLRRLQQSDNPGIRAMLDIQGLPYEQVTERHVSHKIGPMLNAAGRVDDASKGLHLLSARSRGDARAMAEELVEINARRRTITASVEEEALAQADAQLAEDPERRTIVLFSPRTEDGWHPGVVGVVAPRVVSRTGRTAVLFAWDAKTQGWKASGRSPAGSGLNLNDAFAACAERGLLRQYGGHAGAAGCSLQGSDEAAQAAFRTALEEAARAQGARIVDGTSTEALSVQAQVAFEDLQGDLHRYLKLFGPFGQENEPLRFVSHGVEVVSAERMGADGANLRCRVRQGEHEFEAIAWGAAERFRDLIDGPKPVMANLVYRYTQRTFRNRTTTQLEIDDLQVQQIQPARRGGRRGG